MISRYNIRRLAEEREDANLAPGAARSSQSRGRIRYEEPCPIRTAYQRDRDRIIHSKSFRRLKHKTQVFIAPTGDHYVTRLTHTLEVSQIARTIARALNLNEDLTEAIALGHDLGHTPFGHMGEDVLNELYPGGFRHNEQSLRVVDVLEKGGNGLNLTWEVRDGILNHSKTKIEVLGKDWGPVNTLEGEVCRIADIVAYINHDIGDAIRAGIISDGDLPISAIRVLGLSHSQRINTMVCDIIEYSWEAVKNSGRPGESIIGMSAKVMEASNTLRKFLFERVYSLISREEQENARRVICLLYNYLKQDENRLPAEYRFYSDDVERRVVDHIAGMTDQYALIMAEEVQDKK